MCPITIQQHCSNKYALTPSQSPANTAISTCNKRGACAKARRGPSVGCSIARQFLLQRTIAPDSLFVPLMTRLDARRRLRDGRSRTNVDFRFVRAIPAAGFGTSPCSWTSIPVAPGRRSLRACWTPPRRNGPRQGHHRGRRRNHAHLQAARARELVLGGKIARETQAGRHRRRCCCRTRSASSSRCLASTPTAASPPC